jgi:hypothetical protein
VSLKTIPNFLKEDVFGGEGLSKFLDSDFKMLKGGKKALKKKKKEGEDGDGDGEEDVNEDEGNPKLIMNDIRVLIN